MSTHLPQYRQFASELATAIGQTMFDVDDVVKLCVIALYTRGHVLLEGNPGVGKTDLVKTLGGVLQLPFGRIQFTPDLMPADITGTRMPDFEDGNRGQWTFRRGPVLTSLLLADEINRATPKTQSALLEAMAERQVTVLGEQHRLDRDEEGRSGLPFMVLATQNPIDHEGTYDLPEAQMDRFMFKILMTPPRGGTLVRIMEKVGKGAGDSQRGAASGLLPQDRPTSTRLYTELVKAVHAAEVLPSLATHIANIVLASNGQFDELEGKPGSDGSRHESGLANRQKGELKDLFPYFRFGFGPRAAFMLLLGAKAWSLFWGKSSERSADGMDLAPVLVPALRHRMHMHFDWQRAFATAHRLDPKLPLEEYEMRFLQKFASAAAPEQHGYRKRFDSEL